MCPHYHAHKPVQSLVCFVKATELRQGRGKVSKLGAVEEKRVRMQPGQRGGEDGGGLGGSGGVSQLYHRLPRDVIVGEEGAAQLLIGVMHLQVFLGLLPLEVGVIGFPVGRTETWVSFPRRPDVQPPTALLPLCRWGRPQPWRGV